MKNSVAPISSPTPTLTKTNVEQPQNMTFKAFQILAHNPSNLVYLTVKASYSTWVKEKKHELDAKEISSWATQNACGKHFDFFDKIDKKTSAISLNAYCFQGIFANQFKLENTTLEHFQSSPAESHTIKLMQKTDFYRYYEDETSVWLELTFKESPMAFWIALPRKKFDFNTIAEKINPDYISKLDKNLKKERVEVAIPKFQINQKLSIKDLYSELGIDFDKSISKINFSEIVQIAPLEINEQGINSNIAPDANPKKESFDFSFSTKKFIATQPFLVLLKNTKSNEIVLLGRVYKP